MSEELELSAFQLLTPGLYSGDSIKLRVNFQIVNNGFFKYFPWRWKIYGTLDGQIAIRVGDEIGPHGGRDNLELVFSGKMPSGKSLRGELVFSMVFYALTPQNTIFGRKTIVIPNLDDVLPPSPPDGVPPAVCTEGQTRCELYDLYVCRSNQWIIQEYNSSKCGYIVPPLCTDGEEVCKGLDLYVCSGGNYILKEKNSPRCGYVPPDGSDVVPPIDGVPSWLERNKKTIIAVSAVVLAIAITVLLVQRKYKWQKPLKFKKPLVRR